MFLRYYIKCAILCCCLCLTWTGQALAIPQCYTTAAIPAHKIALHPAQSLQEVTSLSYDGKSCEKVAFWQGAPILEGKVYAPFRQVYIAYAKALEANDVRALRLLYAYLRPTPRTFAQWLWLFEAKEGPLMPWGHTTAQRMVQFLQTDSSFERALTQHNGVLHMHTTWPTLYLLMGGEVSPLGDWSKVSVNFNFEKFFLWRYPNYVMQKKSQESFWIVRID